MIGNCRQSTTENMIIINFSHERRRYVLKNILTAVGDVVKSYTQISRAEKTMIILYRSTIITRTTQYYYNSIYYFISMYIIANPLQLFC